MLKVECDREKYKGLELEIIFDGGFWDGFVEVMVVFKLGLKDRKGFIISDWNGERKYILGGGNSRSRDWKWRRV